MNELASQVGGLKLGQLFPDDEALAGAVVTEAEANDKAMDGIETWSFFNAYTVGL